MASKTITSANAVLTLTVPELALGPFQIQGFASDDAFTVEIVDAAETLMGVDGIMSAGFLPFITPMTVTIQADSPSKAFFDTWLGASKAAREITYAQGAIAVPSLGESYILTKGVLKRITQLPPARKTLQPLAYQLDWNDVQPVPLVV